MFQKVSIFVLLATICGLALSASPEWKWVNPSEVVLLRSYPDGYEYSTNTYLYLCRANADGDRWIPGKLQFDFGSVYCVFGVHATVQNRTEFQMLISDPGTTTWVPVPVSQNGTIPDNAIPAGNQRDGSISYACRGIHTSSSSLEVGVWSFGDRNCYFAYDGLEHATRDNVEILTLTAYGQLMEQIPQYIQNTKTV